MFNTTRKFTVPSIGILQLGASRIDNCRCPSGIILPSYDDGGDGEGIGGVGVGGGVGSSSSASINMQCRLF